MTPDQNTPRPIYEDPEAIGANPKRWDEDRPLRLQRFQQIVAPLVSRQVGGLEDSGIDFIAQRATKLAGICGLSAAEIDQARESYQGNPSIDLLYTDDDTNFDYGIEDGIAKHTEETLKAADVLLKALTPELGLNITDDHQTAINKAKGLESKKIALITHTDTWVEFSTVIPGVVIVFFAEPEAELRSVAIETSLKDLKLLQ